MTNKEVRAFAQGCLDYLADIPEEKWHKGSELSIDFKGNEVCCAVGHLVGRRLRESEEEKMLSAQRRQKLSDMGLMYPLVFANDNGPPRQAKQRAVNFLIDFVEGKL